MPQAQSGQPAASQDEGHRERLRHRARTGGLPAFADYELLELYLFRSVPRRDTKERAKALLQRFGSLGAVLSATPFELMTVPDIGEAAAQDLKLVHEMALRMGREPTRRRTVISSWSALLSYVRLAVQHESREQVRVLYLDRKNQLIVDELTNEGTVDHAPVYPREIMRRALELSASAVILVHNHPSGDPTPSKADVEITQAVVAAGKPLGVAVHDHLVVGREGVVSFKAKGLM